ncbi:uncharacterized protein LOC134653345 [Cydia amplana]|uniref:uncharacterized protein LOC134653345 n=1 Tax=Cydia amplana TaxID=1869771 RepID=UPI002FE63A27
MLQKRYTMLPKLKKCCWCLSLRTGCFLLATLSSLICVATITAGAWNLPNYDRPEDNFIAMSAVMFSTLSLISNIVILLGLLLVSYTCNLRGRHNSGWSLSHYERRKDNFIAMSAVMFSTLSLISNIVILLGLLLKRPGFLQLTILFNSVFILCLFLVALVLCLFSPKAEPYLREPLNIVLIVLAICAGVVYSFYYKMVVNSTYRQMKTWNESAIPV